MTSCRDAIKVFEESSVRNPDGTPAAEATNVKLYFMKPPITKLDPAALATLKECTHLALSSNSIDKMCDLSPLENLETLSLGRNNISKIQNLDGVADHLEQLWISYNKISSLSGLERCQKLKILYAGNNNVSDLKEVQKLQALPALEELVLYGNPVHMKIVRNEALMWPAKVLNLLPNLKKLDGISVVEWKFQMAKGNEEQLHYLFEKIDADGSGTIEYDELQAALKDDEVRREMGVSEEKAQEFFLANGQDNNGDDVDDKREQNLDKLSINWEQFLAYFSTKQDLANLIK